MSRQSSFELQYSFEPPTANFNRQIPDERQIQHEPSNPCGPENLLLLNPVSHRSLHEPQIYTANFQ
jgi:hypothetical protein